MAGDINEGVELRFHLITSTQYVAQMSHILRLFTEYYKTVTIRDQLSFVRNQWLVK